MAVGVTGPAADRGTPRVTSLEHPAAVSTAARVKIAVRRSTEPAGLGGSKLASSDMTAIVAIGPTVGRVRLEHDLFCARGKQRLEMLQETSGRKESITSSLRMVSGDDGGRRRSEVNITARPRSTMACRSATSLGGIRLIVA